MVKSETKIAEENISNWRFLVDEKHNTICREHKASCQRFLEWLNRMNYNWTEESKEGFAFKITDLKNAIKKYDEVGI